jgi:hypothetical protein
LFTMEIVAPLVFSQLLHDCQYQYHKESTTFGF